MKYTAKECRCWYKYPNPLYKKDDCWKCLDCYQLVRDGKWEAGKNGKQKTVCRLKEDSDEIDKG